MSVFSGSFSDLGPKVEDLGAKVEDLMKIGDLRLGDLATFGDIVKALQGLKEARGYAEQLEMLAARVGGEAGEKLQPPAQKLQTALALVEQALRRAGRQRESTSGARPSAREVHIHLHVGA